MKHLFENGRIIDGRGNVIDCGWVSIENDRITGVGTMDSPVQEPGVPAEYRFNVEGKTVLPGLIDGHVHICFDAAPDVGKGSDGKSDVELALITAGNAAKTLAAGITTVRDLGGMNFVNISVRDAIYAGHIPGPRILSAGRNICITGGHGWRFGREADGPDDVRRAVREQIRADADVIKFMSTGGTLTKTGQPGQAQLTEEEIRAGIEVAHNAGLKTATHAKGLEATKFAVRSGIDSVEHGAMLDEELIEMMLKQAVFVVPTLTAGANIIKNGTAGGIPEWAVKKAEEYRPVRLESLSKAKASGIKVAFGTDAGTPFNHHGKNAAELIHIQQIGFTPEDALVAATSLTAEMLGIEDTVGTLAPGYIADLLIVDGNPLTELACLTKPENIFAVYQSGKKVARKGRLIL
jgi:imidazolonepropionase-like amidohydrolase